MLDARALQPGDSLDRDKIPRDSAAVDGTSALGRFLSRCSQIHSPSGDWRQKENDLCFA
jgi:hypothetical protein